MPRAAPKPCVSCGVLVADGSGRCDAHKVRRGTFSDRDRGTATERGYGAAWRKLRDYVMRRDGGLCRCAECTALGRVRPAHDVDHIVSKAEWRRRHGTLAGVDALDNLQAINRDCHQAKTAAERAAGRRQAGGG